MAIQSIGLRTHVWNNRLASGLLLAGFPVMIGVMAWWTLAALRFAFSGEAENLCETAWLGKTLSTLCQKDAAFAQKSKIMQCVLLAGKQVWGHMPVILIVSSLWFFFFFWAHPRLSSPGIGTHPLPDVPRYQQVQQILRRLCRTAGITPPRLEMLFYEEGINAYAVGMSPHTYRIVVTEGLLKNLEEDEIEAVLAHELSHIRSEDVRLMMVAMIFTNLVSICNVDGMFSARNRENERRIREMRTSRLEQADSGYYYPSSGGNSDGVAVFLQLLAWCIPLLLVLTGGMLLSWLAYFSLSRKREYIADAEAVILTRKPQALMRALQKISGNSYVRHLPQHLVPMCIDDGDARYGWFFKSHPDITERIARIAAMSRSPARL